MSHFHGPNSQWDINPVVDHDRGLRRGVPHGAKRGGELRPPLFQKAQHGGFARSHHHHTVEGECFTCLGHDDGSPMDGDAVAGNWPPIRAISHSSRGASGTSPCSAAHHRATGSSTAKPPHR
jgi:hypothetical protein